MATIYSWKDMWLSTQWFCCYHFRNAIHVTHKNQESRLINFIVKRTGNSRAAPQFSEIYMKNDSFFLQATFIIVIAHALENVLVNLSCCFELLQKMLLQNKKLTTKLSLVVSKLTLIFKWNLYKNNAHSIFSQVSGSGLIKLSRFLLFRLTFLSIMYQFTALHMLAKGPLT